MTSYAPIATAVEKADTDRCEKCVASNTSRPAKVYPGFKHCWRHMSRSSRALAKKANDDHGIVSAQRYGFYIRNVTDAIKLLRTQVDLNGERGKLYTTDLSEEVALGRLLITQWLSQHSGDPDLPLKDLMQCIDMIGKLALNAERISQLDRAGISEEQLRAIVTAVSHAFAKANLARTPEDRATLFASEIAGIFGGGIKPVNPTPVHNFEGVATRVD